MLGCNALGGHPKFGAAMYISRVNSIVRQLSSSTALNKFVAKFPLLRRDADHIDRWVSLSAASRARRIVLDLCPEVATVINKASYSFLLHLFSGSHLKSLCLGFVSLELPPGPNGFITNLTKLGLHMVSIMGDIQCLLPECDVFEWLSLTECPCTPILSYTGHCSVFAICVLHKIEMQAPNLTDFEFKNYPASFVLGDCHNMSKASIGLLSPEYSFAYACTELPTALPHVHDHLSISLRIRTEVHTTLLYKHVHETKPN
ncbi:hypothetical protein U9M48_034337 [Paspalum notatum var. saurae]|uniref:At1g61320/AtMIF1 LRR domain-containing protein n=1 Tax=Paspalum notatum var. saurae TaxID=547442 RepID=A0AAQ3X8T8_PASNO